MGPGEEEERLGRTHCPNRISMLVIRLKIVGRRLPIWRWAKALSCRRDNIAPRARVLRAHLVGTAMPGSKGAGPAWCAIAGERGRRRRREVHATT